MKKFKVIVYAISKNEEKFVSRWVESMKEADEIIVLDTGSNDNTVKKLQELGVTVKEETIYPFRFDIARNKSLALVPQDTDICVCTDLDEVFEKGWRDNLESIWKENITRLAYNYNWKLDKDNKPLVNFYIEKIHSRNNYTWTHPVHEVLTYIGDKKEIKEQTDLITLNHYPDPTKSRSNYLPLLELSVKEDPEDDRNMHYLGREYMYHQKYNEAIDTLIKHLSLKRATWKDERAASMRFIARCYTELKRYKEAKMWYQEAINEAPYLRDAYVELAILESTLFEYEESKNHCLKALEIKTHPKTYINEQFSFDHTIYDLLAISYYYQGKYEKSLENINRALEISPNNERLKSNKLLIEKARE